ncbi:MAG TPA: MFS transporter [Ktedonobacterales bacterium]
MYWKAAYPVEEDSARGSSGSLWRNRDYLLLWLGQSVSSLGTGISQLAFPLLILAETRSPAAAGVAGALQQAPLVLFSLPAGALVDRWDRQRVMLLSTLGLLLCLASIPVALIIWRLTLAHLYIVAFAIGSCSTFYRLAQLGALTRLVPKAQMSTAVAQNEAAYSATSLLSPSLSGWLFSVAQFLPFAADAISYVILLGSLLNIRAPLQGERTTAKRSLLREVCEGIVWLWSHKLLRLLTFLAGYIELLLNGSILIVLVIAQQHGISAALAGVILGVGGIGNLAGTVLSAQAPLRRARFGRTLRGVMLAYALIWPFYGLAITPLFLGAVMILYSLIDSVAAIQMVSYRMTSVPEHLQGRVSSAYRMIPYAMVALGQALIGVSLQQLGVLPTVALLWAGLLFFALRLLISRKELA